MNAGPHELPETLDELARVCVDCGDRVAPRWLNDQGRCIGCQYRRGDHSD